ncbi:MAG: hypothetical protein N3H84_00295 [Candidatus Caldarchaeum sp.]|nr:hypothetical protein [Candidatus Caldarchaeum sp.]MCX8200533.1 hypothetical protein [Candidatus Caldarchaeum sp.]MDW8434988.1 hypothetical protein [Candidatus Caldarchaeum sp.]
MNVLGGSVYAVVAAARLSKQGTKTTLIHPGRRLGLFPFSVLPEQFFEEMDVKPSKHCEDEITKIILHGEQIEPPTRLYVCRTTPLLEETIIKNEIEFSTKKTGEKFIDCTGTKWPGVHLFQTLQTTADVNEAQLMIEVENNSSVSVTAFFKSLKLKNIYSKRMPERPRNVMAFVERPTAHPDLQTGKIVPTLSFLGPDHAEWHPINSELIYQSNQIIGILQGHLAESAGDRPSNELRFLSLPMGFKDAQGGERLG